MIDLSLKVAAYAGAGLIAVAGVAWFSHHERDIGRNQVQAKWDASKAAQTQVVLQRTVDVATITQQQDAKAQKVDKHVQDQIKIVVADHDRAMSAIAGLRSTLASVRADAMSEATTRASLAAQTASLANSLGECSQRYSEVASQSDGLSVQVNGLLDLLPQAPAIK